MVQPKLYWRYKKDGKWTWKRATTDDVEYALANDVWAQPEEEE